MEDSVSNLPKTASALRARRAAAAKSGAASGPSSAPGSMMKMYSPEDDSPGIKVDPVFVLVGSLTFIASVFILHIVGKYAAPRS